ncbi:unnamed protein product (macronuclear) [Paramecium tetraurelia]|uniref:Uncharacterized protein n=1 Tax=Paramecium tetraurelia TaxID=5888 RepID=A0CQ84_PARTE|nr:uncharacterized protein GSPATT00009299001 [Paramecium tetraurelia]CAK72951.1 unnamed protein product [Paramecium tetraurelia]|eukprot:XP_001440348.1 hypothetical protein (macronuclear) [Paramecium tetraurelia strain d4-2]
MSNFKTLMKMPQSKLASKCLALEELLQRYYEFETAHYDLQSKYQILLDKYESICKKTSQLNDLHTTASQSNKKDRSEIEIGDRIRDLCFGRCRNQTIYNKSLRLKSENARIVIIEPN